MESSRRPTGVFKGRYVDNRPQRNLLRFSSPQQIMEDEDNEEEGVRYIGSKQVARADERKGPQSRRMGRGARRKEGELQSRMAMDDEQDGGIS